MTGAENVAPLPRPAAAEAGDRLRLGLAILQHREFCPDCRPHAEQAAAALRGETLDELARGGR